MAVLDFQSMMLPRDVRQAWPKLSANARRAVLQECPSYGSSSAFNFGKRR